jgi:lipopolysaccharide heptosyltransferase II
MKAKHILAINFGGIGDEILFLPVVSGLKKCYPGCHITLLVEPRARSIAQITDHVDAVLTFDIKKRPLLSKDLLDLLCLLKSQEFDLVVSSGSSPLVSLLLFLSGIPERVGYASGQFANLFLTRPVKLNRNQYAASMYSDLLTWLEPSTRLSCMPHLSVSKAEKQSAKDRLFKDGIEQGLNLDQSKSKQIILIHPGMSKLALEKGLYKAWHPGSWAKLITLLNSSEKLGENAIVALCGGPDDRESITQIREVLFGQGTNVIDYYGKTANLKELVDLIAACDLLVCVDSAPMHIAVALNKPIVALFGPTDEAKLLPLSSNARAIRQDGSVPTVSFASSKTKGKNGQAKAELFLPIEPEIVLAEIEDLWTQLAN